MLGKGRKKETNNFIKKKRDYVILDIVSLYTYFTEKTGYKFFIHLFPDFV